MTEIHEQLISGLTEKIRGMQQRKDLFIKASGLEEEAAKARVEIQDAILKVKDSQVVFDALVKKKSDIVASSCSAIETAMSKLLPYGKAVFKISDDELFIGWAVSEHNTTAYSGLSGGEAAAFRPALGQALAGNGNKLVVIEAAEMDDDKIEALLSHLSENVLDDCQFIVNTCHKPTNIPEAWMVTELL